jgi:hypothetical protein
MSESLAPVPPNYITVHITPPLTGVKLELWYVEGAEDFYVDRYYGIDGECVIAVPAEIEDKSMYNRVPEQRIHNIIYNETYSENFTGLEDVTVNVSLTEKEVVTPNYIRYALYLAPLIVGYLAVRGSE